jgi:hypothetical protein
MQKESIKRQNRFDIKNKSIDDTKMRSILDKTLDFRAKNGSLGAISRKHPEQICRLRAGPIWLLFWECPSLGANRMLGNLRIQGSEC